MLPKPTKPSTISDDTNTRAPIAVNPNIVNPVTATVEAIIPRISAARAIFAPLTFAATSPNTPPNTIMRDAIKPKASKPSAITDATNTRAPINANPTIITAVSATATAISANTASDFNKLSKFTPLPPWAISGANANIANAIFEKPSSPISITGITSDKPPAIISAAMDGTVIMIASAISAIITSDLSNAPKLIPDPASTRAGAI